MKGEAEDSVYTDRLWTWDHMKHDRLCQKYFGNMGQYWNERDPEKVEKFLQDYNDNKKMKLVAIIQYCNVSSGYPVWRLDYKLKRS